MRLRLASMFDDGLDHRVAAGQFERACRGAQAIQRRRPGSPSAAPFADQFVEHRRYCRNRLSGGGRVRREAHRDAPDRGGDLCNAPARGPAPTMPRVRTGDSIQFAAPTVRRAAQRPFHTGLRFLEEGARAFVAILGAGQHHEIASFDGKPAADSGVSGLQH